MPLVFDGVNITNVNMNGVAIDKIIIDGATVFVRTVTIRVDINEPGAAIYIYIDGVSIGFIQNTGDTLSVPVGTAIYARTTPGGTSEMELDIHNVTDGGTIANITTSTGTLQTSPVTVPNYNLGVGAIIF